MAKSNIANLSEEELKDLNQRLQARYTDCNLYSHLIVNGSVCNYCFRQLAPTQDQAFQEALDHFQGLQSLIELDRKYKK